jgi:protein subunit release factor A
MSDEGMSDAHLKALAALYKDADDSGMTLLAVGEYSIEAWPPRQTGGQVVGTGPSGVKVVHLATGLVACCDTGRSQHRNKEIAMHMIEAALTHPRFSA